jgi:hypothetical protein
MNRENSKAFETAERDLRRWRATHPHASFAEIEAAVEEQVRRLRAQLLEDTVAAGFHNEQPTCPHCGTLMQPRTQADRRVMVQGDEAVQVTGAYVVCPACGTGLFPPG